MIVARDFATFFLRTHARVTRARARINTQSANALRHSHGTYRFFFWLL